MGILKKTRCYLIGAIEYSSEQYNWREDLKEQVSGLDIIFFDPTQKPFVNSVDETEKFKLNLKKLRKTGKYDKLSEIMRKIRREDLSLVDRADFNIFYLDLNTFTCGSWEEFYTSIKLQRPTFIIIKQGIKSLPMWLFSCVSSNYIFDSVEDLSNHLKLIDSGNIELEPKRWKLLREEFR